MEAVAYTWFNRLVAVRFMEIHDYLEHGHRVLSHREGKAAPEILEHAEHLDLPGLNPQQVIDLKLAGDKDAELYRMLLLAFGTAETDPHMKIAGERLRCGPRSMLQSPTGGFSPASMAMCDVTRILGKMEAGDPLAAEQLLPLIYDELRKLAADKMAQEKPGQTLQATALVHEAYIRLVDVEKTQHWDSRRHFFSAAAEAMRRILIENARRKKRLKRGGAFEQTELPDVSEIEQASLDDLIDLDQALRKLGVEDPEMAEVVRLRFFAGLHLEEIGQILGLAVPTINAPLAVRPRLVAQGNAPGHPSRLRNLTYFPFFSGMCDPRLAPTVHRRVERLFGRSSWEPRNSGKTTSSITPPTSRIRWNEPPIWTKRAAPTPPCVRT